MEGLDDLFGNFVGLGELGGCSFLLSGESDALFMCHGSFLLLFSSSALFLLSRYSFGNCRSKFLCISSLDLSFFFSKSLFLGGQRSSSSDSSGSFSICNLFLGEGLGSHSLFVKCLNN